MKKILIVDDDEDITMVVDLILRANGYVVDTHSTGFNVPAIVKQHKPDLVLLDINLPGKSGIAICEELKNVNAHPPIVLFSAHAKKEVSLSACRANGFIGKPFEVSVFLETIKAHVA